MDHTGVTPPVALTAPDLAEVALDEGPFLTVYLTTEASVENAAQRSELRWKDLRRDLQRQGADDALVGRLEPRNAPSARVLERLGMRREARLVENEWVKGEWQSEDVYAILDREWRTATR